MWTTPGSMEKRTTLTRKTDSKGRITLGKPFANRTVFVEQRGDEIVVRLARVIPEREAWLYENSKALVRVRKGLDQAMKRKFVKARTSMRRLSLRTRPGE